VDVVHIPYRCAQAANANLLGDRVDSFFDLTPAMRCNVESGKLKAFERLRTELAKVTLNLNYRRPSARPEDRPRA
jgi:hypothetical protein